MPVRLGLQNALPALKFSGAEMAGLHFVDEQKQILFVAKFAMDDQIFSRRDRYSALTLHRLDQNCRGFRRNRAAHRFDVVERHVFESFDARIESFFDFLLTSSSNAGQRSAMKRIGRSNDFVSTALLSKFSSEFEQAFVRFRAAVAEKNA